MQTRYDELLSANEPFEYEDGETPERNTRPGQSSVHIAHLRRLVRKAAKRGILELLVVLYVRVSSGKQGRNGNHDHQLEYIERVIERLERKYGVVLHVIKTFPEVDVSAWRLTKRERPELVRAAKLAKVRDAILVALNTSRFVRNRHHERGVMPTVADFEDLMGLVGNVTLATILDPDQHEDRSADTIRGFHAKDAKPGRPPKKKPRDTIRFRDKNLKRVILARICGLSLRETEKQTGVNYRTADRWDKHRRRDCDIFSD